MSATASSTGAAAGSSSVAGFSSVEDALASFSKGEFVIVLDDEDRENEGDLIIAADNITTEQMAWFIRHTRSVARSPADDSYSGGSGG